MADVSSWLPNLVGPIAITDDGGDAVTARPTVNFIGFTVADDPDNDRTNITTELAIPLDLADAGNVSGILPAANQAAQTMGGDCSGTTASCTVAKVNGIACSGTPAAGAVLRATSASAAAWGNIDLADSDAVGATVLGTANGGSGASNLTYPAGPATLVARTSTETLQNKSMSGSSNTFTNIPIATAISGLGAGVATFLATPSSANFASALTGETGTGGVVFDTSPTISGVTLAGTTTFSGTSVQATGNARARTYSDISNVQTTNATVTTLFSWTIIDEAVTTVCCEVGAVQSDGSQTAGYARRCRFKRDGGTVTAGTPVDVWTDEAVAYAACDLTIDNSTSTGRVRVTGIAATTIDWGGVTNRLEVTHA